MMRYLFQLFILVLTIIGCKKSDNGILVPPSDPGMPLVNQMNVQYGVAPDTSGNNVNLLLDIYFPPAATTAKKYPLFVMIHGGGYVGGDKNGNADECRVMADSGFIAVSINYRLGWRKGAGNCNGDTADLNKAMYRGLQDAHAALRFLVSKKNEYAIDENWIFIGGSSAGGNIALNTAYINPMVAMQAFPGLNTLLGAINTSGNSLTTSFSIKGVCNMWGALKDSSLVSSGNAIPQISFHGMMDNVVPYDFGRFQNCPNYIFMSGSLSLHRQLVRFNKSVITHLSVTGGHGPVEFSVPFMMSNTACFFKKIMKSTTVSPLVITGVVNSCNM
ncbi:MAG TPA: alpha/beta hydrolase [Chitinophagaceae bacterium]|nr:alpha/beta hydrolase [Chitinophagaceae bacterium]HMX77466.1 alpha/beta hydrolase [Chitinophagaceae bacterium]HNA19019.1 alpha/beta hydrolase [Chitinophagaceae bacterium]HNA91373.1 alpha/beta hydrolase [Chitinophagaceae bacterium]HND95428.1 alpha/beta hydrolase [Chitinophagaceae bacterium]